MARRLHLGRIIGFIVVVVVFFFLYFVMTNNWDIPAAVQQILGLFSPA